MSRAARRKAAVCTKAWQGEWGLVRAVEGRQDLERWENTPRKETACAKASRQEWPGEFLRQGRWNYSLWEMNY